MIADISKLIDECKNLDITEKTRISSLLKDCEKLKIDELDDGLNKAKKYMEQLSRKEIGADDFAMFIGNLFDLKRIDEIQKDVGNRAYVQKLYANIKNALLNWGGKI